MKNSCVSSTKGAEPTNRACHQIRHDALPDLGEHSRFASIIQQAVCHSAFAFATREPGHLPFLK
jgi:hypothetical protein